MKTLFKIGVFLVSFGAFASQDAKYCQYWFDYSQPNEKFELAGLTGLSFQPDISSLKSGGHVFQYRLSDENLHWGTPCIKYFYVPLGTMPTKYDKKKYQYWFDNDMSTLVEDEYSSSALSLSPDISGLAEGGHAFNYRLMGENNVWGARISKPFYLPVTPKPVSTKPVVYRTFLNNKLLGPTQSLEAGQTSLNLSQVIPTDLVLEGGKNNGEIIRSFNQNGGVINMQATGYISYAVQFQSDLGKWGPPYYREQEYTVYDYGITPDPIAVPGDYTIQKVDNNHFRAVKFRHNGHTLYIKPTQDCKVEFLYISGNDYCSSYRKATLPKDETTAIPLSSYEELVAVFYDTPVNSENTSGSIDLRIMYEDNKVPKPEITFDNSTWDISIKCDDPRAEIHYAIAGYPNAQSPVYEAPIHVEKNTTIRAYAVLDGFQDSEIDEKTFENLRIPTPKVEYLQDNLFKLTNPIEGVTTYYTLDGTSPTTSTTRIKYEEPFAIDYRYNVRAYSEKEGYTASNIFDQYVYLSDYRTPAPSLYSSSNSYISFTFNEGQAYYRKFKGKVVPEDVEDWKPYEYNSNIEITGNETVQIYASSENKTDSEIVSCYTDWVAASEPDIDYDNYILKLSTDVPGGKIYYYKSSESSENAVEYTGQDGLDMKELKSIYAYVEAEGFKRSSKRYVNSNNFNISSPNISYEPEDGYVYITHDDGEATIVATMTPEQQPEVVEGSNTLRFVPEYNTEIKAYAKKKGYNDSGESQLSAPTKPEINVNDYNVRISSENWYGQEIYYTTDGSKPTKESTLYEGAFDVPSACTVRAVLFVDYYKFIPAEAEPANVLDPAETPQLMINGHYGKLSTSTPNATIYYKADNSIYDSNRVIYDPTENPDGIDLTGVSYLNVYAEADGYRRSETVRLYMDEYSLSEPNISYLDGYVTASGVGDGVLVKFFNQDGKECELDPENPLRAKFVYNDIITAYAYKPGFLDSSYVTIEPCDQPEIYLDKFTVSIVAPYNATVKYTVDGSDPTSESETYSTPFKVTGTCDIKAVAFPRFKSELPSMAVEHVDYVKAKAPTLTSYDGRYVTLSAENEDSKIMYVIGESGNAANGDEALDKIELGGINVIRAIAQNDEEDDSDEFTFTPQYYADETDVYTSAPGVIKNAFGWCEDLSSIEKIAVHGSLLDSSNKDSGDYEYLRSLPGLRHLDLTNVTDTIVPDSALASAKFVSVTMPKPLKNVGKALFGESNSSLCAIELPGEEYAPADLLNGVKNPNLLLYTKAKANVADLRTDDGAEVKNVVLIASGSGVSRADEVTLVNTHAFHAPKEFTAKKISFTRPFTKETQLEGNGAGWETMVVPFEVQSVRSSDDRNLKPFGEANLNAGDCPFWLYKAYDGEWVKDSYIEANSPYLIAFPNNPMYADEYSINGNVTFSSTNVSVPETPADDGESMSANFSASKYVNGNYNFIAKAEDIFALNDEDYTDGNHTYKPGGIFVANQRDVAPFECYVTAASEMKAVPLFDSSDVEGILGEYGTRIWSEGHNIYISSGIGMKIHIFDTVGQLIRIVNVKAGETACAENLTPGIYIVGNTKIYVK